MSAPSPANQALIARLQDLPPKLREQCCWALASGLNGATTHFYTDGSPVVIDAVDAAKLDELTPAIIKLGTDPVIDGIAMWNGHRLVRAFGPGFDGILAAAGLAIEHAAQTDQASQANGAVLECAATIKPEKIDWLWDGWLARSKLQLLAGSPGVGKTTLALKLAASVSTGTAWPDGSTCEASNVVMWTGEDGLADTLVPRLKQAGANLDRVHFVTKMRQMGDTFPFDPATDLADLAAAIERIGHVALLILDPLVAIMGDRNSHNNSEVRRALQPVVDLAAQHGVAVVGITHLAKGSAGRDPLERVIGSIAFAAVARITLVAAKSDEGRMLVRLKSNIGPDGDGYHFQIDQSDGASVTQWGAYAEGDGRELLARFDGAAEATARDDTALGRAIVFLRELLTVPTPAASVKERAEQDGHAEATIRRAAKALGIGKRKSGLGPWYWELPHWPEHKVLTATKHENVEHLEQHEGAQGVQGAQHAQDF